jgi:signal transduction histidine kinase/phage shock protein PspC (stress-responsive transcriptional regulator)
MPRRTTPASTSRKRPFDGDEPLVLGVATALARQLDLDPVAVRVAFVVLTVAGGWGGLLYLAGWVWLVWQRDPSPLPAPLPAQSAPPAPTGRDARRTIGVLAVMFGALLVLRERAPGFADTLVWPVAVVGAGLVLGWRRLNLAPTDATGPRAATTANLARLAGGFVLVVGGLTSLFAANLPVGRLRDGLVAAAVVTVGVLLVLGPWVVQLTQRLADERRERIRADERAEVATHLHDSVLQTLTLLQKRADDPKVMAALARHQERELRRWLYGGTSTSGDGDGDGVATARSFREALEAMASEVEDQHLVQIENVTVGDGPVDGPLLAVVAAAREALVNAAKFSGQRTVSLYAELRDRHVELFVRDRGVGFRPEDVGPDRKGISDSIVGRLERLGGWAHVRSAPGAGTEVRLHLDHLDHRAPHSHPATAGEG